ncbi:MAG TPA: hypothetical protein ENJ10_10670 [Caldithrix abyssi]|uniref:Uncharacterized protein n=1 Tax=Caldithrix abyssi TaxID=187145 RepID=A0A7V1LND9_CALAY|nr:hypothetical protein [Caldithrix abyssi]
MSRRQSHTSFVVLLVLLATGLFGNWHNHAYSPKEPVTCPAAFLSLSHLADNPENSAQQPPVFFRLECILSNTPQVFNGQFFLSPSSGRSPPVIISSAAI